MIFEIHQSSCFEHIRSSFYGNEAIWENRPSSRFSFAFLQRSETGGGNGVEDYELTHYANVQLGPYGQKHGISKVEQPAGDHSTSFLDGLTDARGVDFGSLSMALSPRDKSRFFFSFFFKNCPLSSNKVGDLRAADLFFLLLSPRLQVVQTYTVAGEEGKEGTILMNGQLGNLN